MSWKTLAAKVTLVGCAVACMAPGCNGDVLNDSTFRLWCGDSLCAWHLDAGHVKQTSTWHADDYGVELLDTPTQISQDTREASDCMEFSAVADVDAAAGTRVQVDFNLDGVPDFDEAIAETHWGRARLLIHAPEHFTDYGDRIRVILLQPKGCSIYALNIIILEYGIIMFPVNSKFPPFLLSGLNNSLYNLMI